MNYDGVPARKTGTRLALVGLAILLTSPLLPATADTVHLENGQTMEGIVKEETDTHIVFMQFGIRLVLPRASVSKISYASDAHRETLIKDLQSSKPWQREYYPVAARPFFDRAKALENLQERIEKQDRVVQQIQADHHRARSRTQKEESRLSEIEIQLDATNVDTLQRGTPEYPKRVRLYNQHVTAYNLQVKEVRDATATLESTETDLQRAVDSKNQLQTTYNIRARKLTEDWKKFLRAPSSGENQDEWGKHLAERIHRFQAEPILQGKTDHIRIEHLDRDRMRVTVTADRNGQFILPVLLNQKTNVRLLLDTGATSILLHRNVANRADVHTFNTTQKAQVADGRMVDVHPGVLEELDIFGQHFQSVSIDVIEHETDADIDGLLGMSILKQFEFSIFQDTLTLTVSPESGD